MGEANAIWQLERKECVASVGNTHPLCPPGPPGNLPSQRHAPIRQPLIVKAYQLLSHKAWTQLHLMIINHSEHLSTNQL